MLSKITNLISVEALEIIDNIANKLGLASIVTTVGLTTTQEMTEVAENIPWDRVDYALMISMIGGVLYIIEKLIVIYIRYRQKKSLEAEAERKHKSRNLP